MWWGLFVEYRTETKISVCNVRLFMLMFKSDNCFTDATLFMVSCKALWAEHLYVHNIELNCLLLFIFIPSLIPCFSLFSILLAGLCLPYFQLISLFSIFCITFISCLPPFFSSPLFKSKVKTL